MEESKPRTAYQALMLHWVQWEIPHCQRTHQKHLYLHAEILLSHKNSSRMLSDYHYTIDRWSLQFTNFSRNPVRRARLTLILSYNILWSHSCQNQALVRTCLVSQRKVEPPHSTRIPFLLIDKAKVKGWYNMNIRRHQSATMRTHSYVETYSMGRKIYMLAISSRIWLLRKMIVYRNSTWAQSQQRWSRNSRSWQMREV